MEHFPHFLIGGLSTFSISNVLSGQSVSSWQELLFSMMGGICSAVIVAWFRQRWDKRNS